MVPLYQRVKNITKDLHLEEELAITSDLIGVPEDSLSDISGHNNPEYILEKITKAIHNPLKEVPIAQYKKLQKRDNKRIQRELNKLFEHYANNNPIFRRSYETKTTMQEQLVNLFKQQLRNDLHKEETLQMDELIEITPFIAGLNKKYAKEIPYARPKTRSEYYPKTTKINILQAIPILRTSQGTLDYHLNAINQANNAMRQAGELDTTISSIHKKQYSHQK